jgi:hypothetical protein
MYGLEINSARGDEGWVEVPGLGARPALMGRWSIERRGKPGPDGPVWTLRASLTYQNDALLKNAGLPRRFVIAINKEKRYEAVPEEGVSPTFEEGRLTIEGVHLCPA